MTFERSAALARLWDLLLARRVLGRLEHTEQTQQAGVADTEHGRGITGQGSKPDSGQDHTSPDADEPGNRLRRDGNPANGPAGSSRSRRTPRTAPR